MVGGNFSVMQPSDRPCHKDSRKWMLTCLSIQDEGMTHLCATTHINGGTKHVNSTGPGTRTVRIRKQKRHGYRKRYPCHQYVVLIKCLTLAYQFDDLVYGSSQSINILATGSSKMFLTATATLYQFGSFLDNSTCIQSLLNKIV